MDIRKILPMIGKTRQQQALDQQLLDEMQSHIPEDIRAAHRHSFKNRDELLKSDVVGCFYCLSLFPPAEINEWHDDDQTGFCPKCNIDALVGSAAGIPLTTEFLKSMNHHWF